jgi:hypothetical protein
MSYTTNAHSKKSWKYSFTSTHNKEYTNNCKKTQSQLERMFLANLDGTLGGQGLNEKQVQLIKALLK